MNEMLNRVKELLTNMQGGQVLLNAVQGQLWSKFISNLEVNTIEVGGERYISFEDADVVIGDAFMIGESKIHNINDCDVDDIELYCDGLCLQVQLQL